MTLTKESLIAAFRSQLAIPLKESKELLEIILEEVKCNLEAGDEVKIANFGKWRVRDKKDRVGRNPNTGEPMDIGARRVITFHPSEKLRVEINGGSESIH